MPCCLAHESLSSANSLATACAARGSPMGLRHKPVSRGAARLTVASCGAPVTFAIVPHYHQRQEVTPLLTWMRHGNSGDIMLVSPHGPNRAVPHPSAWSTSRLRCCRASVMVRSTHERAGRSLGEAALAEMLEDQLGRGLWRHSNSRSLECSS